MDGLIDDNLVLNTGLYHLELETPDDPSNAPYGEYLDGNRSWFTVVDNLFNMSILGSQLFSHGFIANNTGDNANRIRRNEFTGMKRAIKLQGDNRTSDLQLGTKYSCNIFQDNLTDIREVPSNIGNPNSWGVPHQFSSGGADPANQFSQSSWDFDDISNTVWSHNYHRIGIINPLTSESTSNISFVLTSSSDDCISISGFAPGGEENSAMQAAGNKMIAESAYAETKSIYDAIIDGGNTDELKSEVMSADFSDALNVYYELMSKSPNVSEEVLIEALRQFDIPNVLLVQILASNPHAAKSERIQGELEERPILFDEYQQQQIMLGLELWSTKENLEVMMSTYLSQRLVAISTLMLAVETDETTTDKTTAKLALLNQEMYFSDQLMKIDLLEASGAFEEARQLCINVSSYFRLTPEEQNDFDKLYQLLEIEETLSTVVDSDLTLSQSNSLYDMLNTTSDMVSQRALDLLIKYDGLVYQEPIVDNDAEERSVSHWLDKSCKPAISIYPNPAKDLTVIEYRLNNAALVEVWSLTSQLLLAETVNPGSQQHSLNLTSLPSSVYEVRILDAKGMTLENTLLDKQ